MAPVANGFPTSTAGAAGRKAPFPHIDDLTSVSVDLDPHTPLRKVLELGNRHMNQAITFKDFRRPDSALQEYIKAFTIAVDKIPKHKDYPSLKTDRGDLGQQYNALKLKITTNGALFDKVKEDIKEDNRKSGVLSKRSAEYAPLYLPSAPSASPHRLNSETTSESNATKGNGMQQTHSNGNERANGTNHTPKPAVQPKPHALHGNTIKPNTNQVALDLANRFAKLRAQESTSSTATVPKPAGPRDMRTQARSRPTVDSSVPTMPKLPDAIYSPARGTVTSEVANLPSSTPRGMFSRTNSIVSASCSSARNSMDGASRPTGVEQFVTAQSFGNGSSPWPRSPRIHIPDGDSITPQQLQEYMQQGAAAVRLLIIDVRSREDFDEGHIMSQATICVEPAVLARENITAEEIEESMNIAPDEELQAFRNRGKCDLLVFYDQDSISTPSRGSQRPQENTLFALYQALVTFNYDAELSNPPKLLAGGLESWVDVFGPHSLQESQTAVAVRDGQSRPQRINGLARPWLDNRRRAKTQTKSLRPEEIKMFEESIREEEAAVNSPREFVRSTEDFLRRYPSASEIQESMTSPDSPRMPKLSRVLEDNAFFQPELPPAPPARPAPALPRTSYSGLSSREPAPDFMYAKSAQIAGSDSSRPPTGLANPGMHCYANSTIQAILASPGFAFEMTQPNWPTKYLSGDKKDPQLMSKILGNLIQWLGRRELDTLKAATLLNYCKSIHTGYTLGGFSAHFRFGDNQQHDAAEFWLFIFEQLGKETNLKQGQTSHGNAQKPRDALQGDPRLPAMTSLDLAVESWKMECSANDSIIQHYWTSNVIAKFRCTQCRKAGDATEDVVSHGHLMITADTSKKPTGTLDFMTDLLPIEFPKVEMVDHNCSLCSNKKKEKRSRFARHAPLLYIQLKRFQSLDGTSRKTERNITFPINDMDLSELAVDQASSFREEADKIDGFGTGYRYKLYAVICHAGSNPNSGHYTSYVREGDSDKWWFCNDQYVSEVSSDVRELWTNNTTPNNQRGMTPYMLFYKRKDADLKLAYTQKK
ncbi:uncharacterized protein BCR38DRAFT_348440 [Pseudomassariella vexata]|uniref:Ubiquitin carboxyl-terminal hydrolase n=1 Tax=Pseudomassariella vexata TaxID=1141098 RepID=A0A1Y2DPQ5_9PEZI|nr:uncharacterized protein BCR38DRAFT_348440 [Pseudomassariella vexata]ORY61272.1 hypothetical protein BCR38DRAFT_348440 [Pseudomassariella vexata]